MKRLPALLALLLLALPASALGFYSFSPFYDVRWTLETIRGWQRGGVISSEGGGNSQTQQVMEVQGLLFQSYYKERLLSKAQLNMAFTKSPKFLWTERPDFTHDDSSLNKNLKCVEFDFQAYLPRIWLRLFSFLPFSLDGILPFAGYSFVNYTDNDGVSEDTFSYSNVSGGIQFYQKISRHYTHTFFVSYSPMFLTDGFSIEDILHYVNYGGEFMATFRYFSLNLFVSFRRAFVDFRRLGFFDETKYRFNMSEVGFSFRVTL